MSLYNLALFLHVLSAFTISAVSILGIVSSLNNNSSVFLRLNLLLVSVSSIISILTAVWIIQITRIGHGTLWISISYFLWIIILLINEVILRRKYRLLKANKSGVPDVFKEYIVMALIVVVLTALMIFKPTI